MLKYIKKSTARYFQPCTDLCNSVNTTVVLLCEHFDLAHFLKLQCACTYTHPTSTKVLVSIWKKLVEIWNICFLVSVKFTGND